MSDGSEVFGEKIDWDEGAWAYMRLPVDHMVRSKARSPFVTPILDAEAPFNEVVEKSKRVGAKYAVVRRTGAYWLIVGYVDATGQVTVVRTASHISTSRKARRAKASSNRKAQRAKKRSARKS